VVCPYVCVCARTRASVVFVVQLKHFADLLEKIFILDPAKRLTVSEALKHEFIRDLPPA